MSSDLRWFCRRFFSDGTCQGGWKKREARLFVGPLRFVSIGGVLLWHPFHSARLMTASTVACCPCPSVPWMFRV